MSLRFCVKSFFEDIEVLKMPFLGLCMYVCTYIFCSFGKYQPPKSEKIHEKSIFRAFQCVKMADFQTQDWPTLISRKI